MISTGVREIRYAYSMLTGRRFNTNTLRKLVADVRDTVDEFGELTNEVSELLMIDDPDTRTQQEVSNRRIRQAVATAAKRTAYYREWFARSGVDPETVTAVSLADSIPVTPKSALKASPAAFVSDASEPVLLAQTTGSTGMPTSVWFSAYELEVLSTLDALGGMLTGGLRPRHMVASFASSRAMLSAYDLQRTSSLIGNGCVQVGMVDPRIAVERLATPLGVSGKAPQVSHMMANPSYLGCLIDEVERGKWSKADFRLQTIFSGGEILTEALRQRAEEAFGAPVVETYSATEITPVAAQVCSARHLHMAPHHGYIEILDPTSHRPVDGGEVGVLVVTPYPPFRDTTLLLRYDTGDLVRRLPHDIPLTCELRGVPATSQVLGRAGSDAGASSRDVLEAIQAEPELPFPSRFAMVASPGGPILYVVAPRCSRGLASRLETGIADRGIAVDGLILVEDPADLPRPCPVRADLREHSFEVAPRKSTAHASVVDDHAFDLMGSVR